MDEDLSNNSSYWRADEPLEQKLDRKKERAAALETINELKQIIEHFDERIAFRDTLSAVNVDLAKDPALHQKICEVNELLKLGLIEERGFVQELIDMYEPR